MVAKEQMKVEGGQKLAADQLAVLMKVELAPPRGQPPMEAGEKNHEAKEDSNKRDYPG